MKNKSVLKFLICGSVDSGKSSLIGRLLYDTNSIPLDQLSDIIEDSKTMGTRNGTFDPALLTDGLRAEREQGITIDVAYRYFSTTKRKFIIADTPGHEQYTRNTITAASNCDLAVLVIDAKVGITEQTKRHTFICSLMGIKDIIIVVNKMDLVEWNQSNFDSIISEYEFFIDRLTFNPVHYIPISTVDGTNIIKNESDWYRGEPLLNLLESINIAHNKNKVDFRFSVQMILRPNSEFRGIAGRVLSGILRKDDEVLVLPSNIKSRIEYIYDVDGNEIKETGIDELATIILKDNVDVSRGDMLVHPHNIPRVNSKLHANIIWMDLNKATLNKNYLIQHLHSTTTGRISSINYTIDINTFRKKTEFCSSLNLNDIARATIEVNTPIYFDSYNNNKQTGSFIIIDPETFNTVGAGLILDVIDSEDNPHKKPKTIWMTGLSGSGKTTIAKLLQQKLLEVGLSNVIIDGDILRDGLTSHLGFSLSDRKENMRIAMEIAKLINLSGVSVICSLISPIEDERDKIKEILNEYCDFYEVFINASLDVCIKRDPKGLYARLKSENIRNFTGIDSIYDIPKNPDVIIDTENLNLDKSIEKIINYIF